ncbi:hypothetical protein DLAC_11543 [Tieghemostelium lacteum]|uniref:Transmembrane protein n=1 Tax=Tieghemostelium lacteum TaxID=361077 RepID=A0A152A1I9_TIELA|nr:hypothetical protein DLAC_11543 [Tieghemostelium lacteum]|eukprot:KYR00074.1 hypothetical protein DLAC_11543 [Tieghemostelium lacteum]
MNRFDFITTIVILVLLYLNVFKCQMLNGIIQLSDSNENLSTIVYQGNSDDYVIASSSDSILYRIQVSEKSIQQSKNITQYHFNPNSISSGYLDEKSGFFYIVYQNTQNDTTTLTITKFTETLDFIYSMDIVNQDLPFYDNSLFVDDLKIIYLITNNGLYRLESNENGFSILESVYINVECIQPTSATYNPTSYSILLGCLSNTSLILEYSKFNLSMVKTQQYYYGTGIYNLLMVPNNSISFLGGSQNVLPYHLVTFSLSESTSIETNSMYRNREMFYGNPTTASTDGQQYAFYIFGQNILLFNLLDKSNTPVDLDYFGNITGLSSVFSPKLNVVLVSTSSTSTIYLYNLPEIQNTNENIKIFFVVVPIVIIILSLAILLTRSTYLFLKNKTKRLQYQSLLL